MALRVFASLLVVFAPAVDSLAQESPLAPLARLEGHCWQGEFAEGGSWDRHCFEWVYDGLYLSMLHRPDPGRRHLIVAMTDGMDAGGIVGLGTIDELAIRTDGVVHVLSRSRRALLRWSSTTRGFLTPVPLRQAPPIARHFNVGIVSLLSVAPRAQGE